MPITWKNVQLGNNGSANALLAAGSNTMVRGLETLTGLAEDQSKQNVANYNTGSQQNTTDALAKLNSLTNSTDLAAAMRGGELDTANLDSSYGKQYDKRGVSTAVAGKYQALLANEKSTAMATLREGERIEDRAQKKVDDQTARENAKIRMGHTLTTWGQSQAEWQTNEDKRLLNLDIQQNISRIRNESGSPEDAELNVQRYLNDTQEKTQGFLGDAEVASFKAGASAAIRGAGLTPERQEQVTRVGTSLDAMQSNIAKQIDALGTAYMEASGVTKEALDVLADPTGHTDAMELLKQSIIEKGDSPKYDTIKIVSAVDQIKDLFKDSGIHNPTGKMVYDVLTQSGYDDSWYGGDWIGGDSEYMLNTDVANEYIGGILRAKKFLTTDAANVEAINALKLSSQAHFNKVKGDYEKASNLEAYSLAHQKDLNSKYNSSGFDIKSTKVPDIDPEAIFKEQQQSLYDLREKLELGKRRMGLGLNRPTKKGKSASRMLLDAGGSMINGKVGLGTAQLVGAAHLMTLDK